MNRARFSSRINKPPMKYQNKHRWICVNEILKLITNTHGYFKASTIKLDDVFTSFFDDFSIQLPNLRLTLKQTIKTIIRKKFNILIDDLNIEYLYEICQMIITYLISSKQYNASIQLDEDDETDIEIETQYINSYNKLVEIGYNPNKIPSSVKIND